MSTTGFIRGAIGAAAVALAMAGVRGATPEANLASPWVELANARVRLLAGPADMRAGQSYLAGVELLLADGWKTYWRMPGDAGVPPSFDWAGSRNVARKAQDFLRGTGIADVAYFGPEAEFYIFDSARFETGPNAGYYYLDSVEGAWNTGRDEEGGNLAYKPRYKGGYFPVPPMDHYTDLRSEMVRKLIEVGITVEMQHHEVGTAGQAEIDIRFAPLLTMADHLMLYKYVVKSTARAAGKTVTFMPKPLFGDNGNGMHCHQSIWKDGSPLFYDEVGYAGLSDTGRYYVGGLLKHAPSLLAFTNPTANSYHRLVPGFEAPVNLVYSQRNRSAALRIPVYSPHRKAKRLEFRCPDGSCNPYLAFAAMLMAMLDGIKNKIKPGEPLDKDIYDLGPEELERVPKTPGSLEEALANLRRDHEFLLHGDVFTADVIDTWIWYKREKEVDAIRLRPHPYEFALYYDI